MLKYDTLGNEINLGIIKIYQAHVPCDGRVLKSDDIFKCRLMIIKLIDFSSSGAFTYILDTSVNSYEMIQNVGGITFVKGVGLTLFNNQAFTLTSITFVF